MSANAIEFRAVSKRFGALSVLDGLTFAVEAGAGLRLLGPSGSGKTTVMRLMAGLDRPDSGVIEVRGERVAGAGAFVPPVVRRVGMVFQDFALWPHMRIEAQLRFVMAARGLPRSQRGPRARTLLELVELEGRRRSFPDALSGGEQQRAAIARTLAAEPDILLLDEPFSNIDGALRERIAAELLRRRSDLGVTIVLATHHGDEAEALCRQAIELRRP